MRNARKGTSVSIIAAVAILGLFSALRRLVKMAVLTEIQARGDRCGRGRGEMICSLLRSRFGKQGEKEREKEKLWRDDEELDCIEKRGRFK